jgi:hypothetical protein
VFKTTVTDVYESGKPTDVTVAMDLLSMKNFIEDPKDKRVGT